MAAQAEAKRRGADDAVFLGQGDVVLEGPVTNVWWRNGRTLFTAALELGILAGVTRATLLEEAGELGYEVREGAFPRADLGGARGGVHVLLRAGGHAGRRARRRADPARRRGSGAAGRAPRSRLRLRDCGMRL